MFGGRRPFVSIILVNYNGAKDTIECVESLNQISYPNFQIIVVDNASTDQSLHQLRSADLPNTVVLESDTNLGFSGGNNLGIRYALEHNTDYILLLNNDTLVAPDFLDVLTESMSTLPAKTLLTGKILYAYEPNTIWYAGGSFDEKTGRTAHCHIGEADNFTQTLQEVSFISGCCLLLQAEAVRDIGELDESFFLYCEDLEYCCRARQKGYSLYYEPRAVIFHKVSASTGRSSPLSVYYTARNSLYIIDRYIHPRNRLSARLFFYAQTAKRVLTREYPLASVMEAMQDYRRGIIGKK